MSRLTTFFTTLSLCYLVGFKCFQDSNGWPPCPHSLHLLITAKNKEQTRLMSMSLSVSNHAFIQQHIPHSVPPASQLSWLQNLLSTLTFLPWKCLLPWCVYVWMASPYMCSLLKVTRATAKELCVSIRSVWGLLTSLDTVQPKENSNLLSSQTVN